MKYELTIYELGEFLKNLEMNYKLDVLIKRTLSGGWMTLTGEAKVEELPSLSTGCKGSASNILGIRILTDNNSGAVVKVTGSKTKKFTIEVSPTRYKEISINSLSLNQIKINENECKLRIDEDMIFTIKARLEDIVKLISCQ